MGLLDGKVALITGATRGIGREIALRFASEGADIAFTGRHEGNNSKTLVEAIEKMGRKAVYYMADASSFELAHESVDKVIADFGKIDILVNNAGVVEDALVLRMNEHIWDKVIDTDLKSAFNYIHAALPSMARARTGSIINISSVVGLAGNAGQANYAAAKAGMIGLAKSVAKEMGSRNIRVNCIAPGFIDSEMTASLPEQVKESYLSRIALHRPGTLAEVAGVALFLASDISSYVTGQVISCCGGLS